MSKPNNSKGSSLRISPSTSLSRVCSRYRSGAHSVHPVAMSVTVSVCTKLPFATGPQCATRSASTNPGGGSSQSENVRTGMLLADRRWRSRPTALPAACLFADLAKRPVDRRRAHGEYCGADLRAESQVPVPFHRLDQYVGISAFRRLPQMRSDASHSTTIASRTASS